MTRQPIAQETPVAPSPETLRALASSFRVVFGERLVALALYGSAADGSAIPGFSDLDVAVFLRGKSGVEEAISSQAHLTGLEIEPFDYLGPRYLDVDDNPSPALIPGGFAVFWGEIPELSSYLHDGASLQRSGRDVLTALPSLLAEDRAAWSAATGSTRRRQLVRAMLMQLKPAIRAHLVELGEPPETVWVANWPRLIGCWRRHDLQAADLLVELVNHLPPRQPGDEADCGAASLRLLARIASDG